MLEEQKDKHFELSLHTGKICNAMTTDLLKALYEFIIIHVFIGNPRINP